MHCGCPLPGETIGQKLSRLVKKYHQCPAFLRPPDHRELLASTHPSDHNAVYVFHHKKLSESSRKKREAKIAARRRRDLEQLKEGKIDRNTVQREDHDSAFLTPVPIYYYSPMPACAAYSGNVVDGNNGGRCAAVSLGCPRLVYISGFYILNNTS